MKCVMNIFDSKKLIWEDWQAGEHYAGASVEMGREWKMEKLGFHLESLAPGKFGCPYHTHEKEEELFLAIHGEATVRQDGEFYGVKPGDLFVFKPGSFHQTYNHTKEPFIFFALSNIDREEICHYPDSHKQMDRRTHTITQNGVKVEDYWKDEEDPRKFWPKELVGLNR